MEENNERKGPKRPLASLDEAFMGCCLGADLAISRGKEQAIEALQDKILAILNEGHVPLDVASGLAIWLMGNTYEHIREKAPDIALVANVVAMGNKKILDEAYGKAGKPKPDLAYV